MTIRYKRIPNWDGYRAGSDGSIWSEWERTDRNNGRKKTGKWRRLPQGKNSHGRLYVWLNDGNKSGTYLIHRLILETFVGPCPHGMECRHWPDIDPTNNTVDNLSWGTRKQNMEDRDQSGNTANGDRHYLAKLSVVDVLFIREKHRSGWSSRKLARLFGVAKGTIDKVISRKSWKYV